MFDAHEYVTNTIIEGLKKGVIPWKKPWNTFGPRHPTNYLTGNRYNGINILLLNAEAIIKGYRTNYWMGYDQAKKAGATVKKGEKHTKVVFMKNVIDNDTEKVKYFYFNYFRVFNIDQMDGIEIDTKQITFNPIQEAESLFNSMTDIPPILYGFDRACYIPSKDIINLPSKESFSHEEAYYETLFHELVHSTSSDKRLNRDTSSYASEELVAELGSAILCSEAGIVQSVIDNSQAYINGWIKDLSDHPKMIMHCAALANKAIEYLVPEDQAKTA
jgi:antirestriction protein ArdC